jgi:hypothetical protein
MAVITSSQTSQPYDSVFVSAGAPGTGVQYTNTTAVGYRFWVAPFPVYVIGITVHNETSGTAAGTLRAGYATTNGATAAVLTTTNFGDSTVTHAQGNVELTIAKSGTTDDEKPLLIPAGSVIGFNSDASVTSAGPRVYGVTIRFRRAG